jgi:hypothetical protein
MKEKTPIKKEGEKTQKKRCHTTYIKNISTWCKQKVKRDKKRNKIKPFRS